MSSHLDQRSKQINHSNQKINSYDKMSKIITNLGSKKGDNNDDSYTKLTHIQNALLTRTADTL